MEKSLSSIYDNFQSNNGLVPAKISELLIACEKCRLRWSDKTALIVPSARLKPGGEETWQSGHLDFRTVCLKV